MLTYGAAHRRRAVSRAAVALCCAATLLPVIGASAHASPSRTTTAPFGGTASSHSQCREDEHLRPDRHSSLLTESYDAAAGTYKGSSAVRIDPSVGGVAEPAVAGRQQDFVSVCRTWGTIEGIRVEHLPSSDDVLDVEIRYSVPAYGTSSSHPRRPERSPGTTAATETWHWSSFSLRAGDDVVGWAKLVDDPCACAGISVLPGPSDEVRVLHVQARTRDGSRWGRGALALRWDIYASATAVEYAGNIEHVAVAAELGMQLHSITVIS